MMIAIELSCVKDRNQKCFGERDPTGGAILLPAWDMHPEARGSGRFAADHRTANENSCPKAQPWGTILFVCCISIFRILTYFKNYNVSVICFANLVVKF